MDRLLDEGIRAEYDDSKENMGKKIRNSNVMKNSISVIIGDNERDNGMVSFRRLGDDENYSLSVDEFVEFIKDEIKKR